MRLALVSLVVGALVAATSATASAPRLLFGYGAVDAVRGVGFVAGERVILDARVEDVRVTRTVVAGPRGGFVWRLRVPNARCAEVFVRAVGNRGSRAKYVRPAPACREP